MHFEKNFQSECRISQKNKEGRKQTLSNLKPPEKRLKIVQTLSYLSLNLK